MTTNLLDPARLLADLKRQATRRPRLRKPAVEAAGAHRIVIVGGGAGGLELATRLGDTLGRRGEAQITLIDRSRVHLWKPMLHEIAAGSMDLSKYELDYLAQSHWHHFQFRYGDMTGLDRVACEVQVAALHDDEGREIAPRRAFGYDTLVIAVGSGTNDFGIKGVREFSISLDSPDQATRFHRRIINACMRANTQTEPLAPEQLQIAIIGAGATGVELAAELHKTMRQLVAYGYDRIDPERQISIHVLEAAERILPGLPPRLSEAAMGLLAKLGVQVHVDARVVAVTASGVTLASGATIPAELVVWAAGVKAPDFLAGLAGLETNRINQLVVRATLQTTRDERIYALGDCAACPWMGEAPGKTVPPRAQAAHQQSSYLARTLTAVARGNVRLEPYIYRDFGSLVSMGNYSTVGSLMGGLFRGSVMIEGYFALIMYKSLYKMHEFALHGAAKVVLETLARMINRRTEPQVKLH